MQHLNFFLILDCKINLNKFGELITFSRNVLIKHSSQEINQEQEELKVCRGIAG